MKEAVQILKNRIINFFLGRAELTQLVVDLKFKFTLMTSY